VLPIRCTVEGLLDESALAKVLGHLNYPVESIDSRGGKSNIRARIHKYDAASRFQPWMVLVDLDNEFPCPPALRRAWLGEGETSLCLRIAVRSIESWLMGDSDTLAWISMAEG
jgi:hypothetical protein